MSIATWLKSEPTVLLWGDRWWLPQHKLAVPFTGFEQAAEVLASVWPFPVRSMRLIYQPDRLTTVPVACPNGKRATLALALGDEFPALVHPAHVWGFEPILPAAERFSTLLHFETEPGLFALVQQLHRHGLAVRSAWPLATWLDALPPELTESGALTVVALHADRWHLWRHSSAGGRFCAGGVSNDVPLAVADHLREVAAKAEVEYVLFVSTDDALVAKVEERVTLAPNQIHGVHLLWEALARPVTMAEKHPAQLLPPVPFVTPPRIVGTASLLLMAAALGMTGWQVQSHHEARIAAEREAESIASLETEIAHLRENAVEISRLRAALDGESSAPGLAALLRHLGSVARPGIALQSLVVSDGAFTLKGGVAVDAPQAWNEWSGAIQTSEKWSMQATEPDEHGRFEVGGVLRP